MPTMTPACETTGTRKMRKACDLCYRKRIKCDGKSPRCTHCEVYETECTHDAESRPKKRKRATAGHITTVSSRANLEEPPQRRARDRTSRALPVASDTHESSIFCSPGYHDITVDVPMSAPRKHMDLPPRETVLRLVDVYLTTFNNILPLYDPRSLYRMVETCYDDPSRRDDTCWASINIVMAIAQIYSPGCDLGQQDGTSADECISRAQSVANEIFMGDVSLANLQVALGLVILFQGSPSIRPALFFISAAFRLVHMIGIHRRETYTHLTPQESIQRQRVFWIAYILDKDLSLRTRQPPIQQDSDMDIDLPSESPGIQEATGYITVGDGKQPFNVFYAFIDMARIEGMTYHYLISARSLKMDPTEIAEASQSIRLLIESWESRIPAPLTAEALCQDKETSLPRFFCTLYSRIIECLGHLGRVSCKDLNWFKGLLAHARLIGSGQPSTPPLEPDGWAVLVSKSRSLMPLFMSVERKDTSFIWMHLCPYVSALLCLSANSLVNFYDANASNPNDHLLKAEALAFIRTLAPHVNNKVLDNSIEAFDSLDWYYNLMIAGSDPL